MLNKNYCGKLSILTITLGLLATIGIPDKAYAQGTSPGCSALSGGIFDQTVPAGGIGTTMSGSFNFNPGDDIRVRITDATNSLFLIDSNTIFSGETGSQTKAFTVTTTGPLFIVSDIQGLPGSTASITTACKPGATGGTGGGGTTTAAAVDKAAAVDAAVDALDVARPSTKPGDLPSRFSSSEQKLPPNVKALLKELAILERVSDESVATLEDYVLVVYGIKRDDIAFNLIVASFIDSVKASRTSNRNPLELVDEFNKNVVDYANSILPANGRKHTVEGTGTLAIKAASIITWDGEVKRVREQLAREGFIDEANKPQVNRRATIPLSFVGSNNENLQFSTKGLSLIHI